MYLLAVAWHLAPRGVQIASIPFGHIFNNVCFHGKKPNPYQPLGQYLRTYFSTKFPCISFNSELVSELIESVSSVRYLKVARFWNLNRPVSGLNEWKQKSHLTRKCRSVNKHLKRVLSQSTGLVMNSISILHECKLLCYSDSCGLIFVFVIRSLCFRVLGSSILGRHSRGICYLYYRIHWH